MLVGPRRGLLRWVWFLCVCKTAHHEFVATNCASPSVLSKSTRVIALQLRVKSRGRLISYSLYHVLMGHPVLYRAKQRMQNQLPADIENSSFIPQRETVMETSHGLTRPDRKTIEKNRRIHMKALYSKLLSLLPTTSSQVS